MVAMATAADRARERERERERERGREREGEGDRECRSIALRSVDPYTSAPLFSLYMLPFHSASVKGRTVLTQRYLHIFTLNVLHSVSSSYTTSQMLCSNIHLHKDWRCQIRQTPTQASAAREYLEGRSTFKSLTRENMSICWRCTFIVCH